MTDVLSAGRWHCESEASLQTQETCRKRASMWWDDGNILENVRLVACSEERRQESHHGFGAERGLSKFLPTGLCRTKLKESIKDQESCEKQEKLKESGPEMED